MTQSPEQILQEYWGHKQFRPMQQQIVQAVLDGYDVLALLPTGGGKSVCFQVPALVMDGICLVVSPLIALMKDQVENLRRKGILALAVYSGMSFAETKRTLENAAYGNYKFLYVSAERLETKLFQEYLPVLRINSIAVDEAHCVSQWGYDFRPSYLRIAALRESLPGVPMIALTASATKEVQQDIAEKLQLSAAYQLFQQSFERSNLSYSVFNVEARQNKLLHIVQQVPGSGIVYCRTRKHTQEVAQLLKTHGIAADFYHAGLGAELRTKKQDDWINNRTRIMACTNAFGMGIDKPDVRLVVHYNMPDCTENYYQEAGRAGRDGKRAYAVLLYTTHEAENLQQQIEVRYPDEETVKKVYKALMNYLQVPADDGGGVSYDFDITRFADAFKLPLLTATYAIKALEQEALLLYNEVFFKSSSLVFTISKKDLADFEVTYPLLEPVLKGLLRSYEGIFDTPVNIYESRLSRFIKMEISVLRKSLLQLHQYGVVEYSPQKDTPQLQLLQNRSHTDWFSFNSPDYFRRKELYKKRLAYFTAYLTNKQQCRSQQVAAYFNSPPVKPCGICDNCIGQKTADITTDDFDVIAERITDAANTHTVLNELERALGKVSKEKFWKVLEYLIGEGKIAVDKQGRLLRPGAQT